MFIVVSNISRDYNAFFRVIPYDGPQIEITGAQPYDVVSNTITLQAKITDLSGVTNEWFELTVDGDYARYGIGTNNTIPLETKYNPNGSCSLYVKAGNRAQIADPANPPMDTKLSFSGSTSLPLDFENDTCMVFSGDNCSPEVGTNYILFAIDKAQDIEASISDPSNGQVVFHYAGHVPYPATIQLPWNFTKADGVTPYTNDTYVVKFVAYDPTTLTKTNSLVRDGVRIAARNIVTYEEDDPNLSYGAALNAAAEKFVGNLEIGLYEMLYSRHVLSLTAYETYQIGLNRENVSSYSFPWVFTHGQEATWTTNTMGALDSVDFSDFTYYAGHANGTELGGGPRGSTFVTNSVEAKLFLDHVVMPKHSGNPNWRMRKVALWGCYTYSDPADTAGGTYTSWPKAFGIQRGTIQMRSWSGKNVGLFFRGGLPMRGYQYTTSGASVEAATDLDIFWVCGANPYPGACDPTYAFSWAVTQIENLCPELKEAEALPTIEGFQYLPYAGVYDSELMTNNIGHVKQR